MLVTLRQLHSTVHARLPPRPFMRTIALRSIAIWFGLRLALAVLGILTPPVDSIPVAMLVTGLTRLETARLKESLFLYNLGVPSVSLTLTAAALPTLLEAIIAALVILW